MVDKPNFDTLFLAAATLVSATAPVGIQWRLPSQEQFKSAFEFVFKAHDNCQKIFNASGFKLGQDKLGEGNLG